MKLGIGITFVLASLVGAATPALHAAERPARGAASVQATTQAYTAAAMWRLKRLSTPAISPDARLAVVAVSSYDAAQSRETTNLWLVPTRAGKARQLTSGANDHSPTWSPDGRLIAFVAQRADDEQPQVYVIAVDGGEARRVTNVPTGAAAPRWFPDSQRIAFLSRVWSDLADWQATAARLESRDNAPMTARVWDRPPMAHWDSLLDDRQLHLFWTDLGAGEPQPITLRSGRSLDITRPSAGSYDISPDGLEVAFAADSDLTATRPNLDIYVLPLAGGAVRNLTADNPANDLEPRYSPDGRLLAFGRQLTPDFYADRLRLMVLDRRSQTLKGLADDWDRSVDGIVWAPDSRSLLGTVDDAGAGRVYRFDVAGGTPTALTADGSFSDLGLAGSGPVIIALRSSFTEPPTLVSIIPRAAAATKLSDFNDVELGVLAQGRVESVEYPGAHGATVQMWVVYPPGFTPGRRWPLLLLLHGGPHDSVQDALQWRWNAQVFASWGYVVAWPNFHGSSGFGTAFADSAARDWAELPYQDTIRAAAWFSAQPWIDGERMAAGGGSFGGYLATVLLGRTHPFKTLIAQSPVYNLFDEYAMDKGARARRFGEHWQDRERFERNSPHLAAGNFNTPTLVIHGQQDLRVPVSQSIALFNTLQNRGIDSRLLYFPDENHWIQKPQNSLFWYDTVQQWLAKYVQPGPGTGSPPAMLTPAE